MTNYTHRIKQALILGALLLCIELVSGMILVVLEVTWIWTIVGGNPSSIVTASINNIWSYVGHFILLRTVLNPFIPIGPIWTVLVAYLAGTVIVGISAYAAVRSARWVA